MRAPESIRRMHLGHSLTDCSSRKSATTNARPGNRTPAINQSVALQPLSLAALAVAAARKSTKITASMLNAVSVVMASSASDNPPSHREIALEKGTLAKREINHFQGAASIHNSIRLAPRDSC